MRASASPVYYGWFVLAASAMSELLVQGATSYAAGLFVLPLQAEFHISRADASSSILILFLGAGLSAPLVGRLLDRFPIRRLICAGAAIFALSFAAIAASASLWVMAAILLLPGALAFMLLGPLMTSTLTTRWFFRRRGLALGLAAVATSGGGFLVVPLLSAAIQRHGWRTALSVEGLAIGAIVIALALLVLRDNPADSDPGAQAENQGRAVARPGAAASALRWTQILSARAFWMPSIVLAAISGTCQALVVTLVPYGIGLHVAPASVALLISAFALAAAATKVLAGLLADYVNPRHLLAGAALFMTLCWLSLSLSDGYAALLAGACCGGIALGCALPTAAALVAAHFGSDRFGAAMGWSYALIFCCAIAAVRFIGFIYDSRGGYGFAFDAFAALLACLLAATLLYAWTDPGADPGADPGKAQAA